MRVMSFLVFCLGIKLGFVDTMRGAAGGVNKHYCNNCAVKHCQLQKGHALSKGLRASLDGPCRP